MNLDKKKKSRKGQEKAPFELSGLVFAQISAAMLLLILLLFIRLLHTPTFKGIMSEYDQIFGKDIPLSVIADKVSECFASSTEPKENTEETTDRSESDAEKESDDADIPNEAQPTTESPTEKIGEVSVSKKNSPMINEMELPIKKGKLTSKFGYRTSPITGEYCLHGGVDLATDMGNEIYAALDGTVIASVEDNEIGYYVKIDHGNGVVTAYGHCSKLIAKKGDKVKKGDVIALVGSTGHSTGPHTHFEVRINGEKIDPARVLDLSKLNAS